MLLRRWERARQGDGQLVLMVGKPGLGKSHLIEEFHARLREVPHTWAEWSCSQLLQLPLQQTPMERRMRKSQTHSGPSVRSPAMTSAPPQSENHVGLTFWKNALTKRTMIWLPELPDYKASYWHAEYPEILPAGAVSIKVARGKAPRTPALLLRRCGWSVAGFHILRLLHCHLELLRRHHRNA